MGDKNEPEFNPKPEREHFDRVLRTLLNAEPVTRKEVHKETRKRKKKVGKIIQEDHTAKP
jgi:hypothetical protein